MTVENKSHGQHILDKVQAWFADDAFSYSLVLRTSLERAKDESIDAQKAQLEVDIRNYVNSIQPIMLLLGPACFFNVPPEGYFNLESLLQKDDEESLEISRMRDRLVGLCVLAELDASVGTFEIVDDTVASAQKIESTRMRLTSTFLNKVVETHCNQVRSVLLLYLGILADTAKLGQKERTGKISGLGRRRNECMQQARDSGLDLAQEFELLTKTVVDLGWNIPEAWK